ncbi:MAG: hypothetical protein WC545_04060 [Patescibacteria group bacterium]
MKNILITGFYPFGDYKVNPTEQFLKSHSVLGELYLYSLIFPPRTFGDGAENFGLNTVKFARSLNAIAIISLGMASDVKGLRIETSSINWSEGKYCLDFEQKKRLDSRFSSRATKKTNLAQWDIEAMLKNFKNLNIKFERKLSESAGTYCCNALMYRVLSNLEPSSNIPYIFLHIPCSAEAVAGIDNFNYVLVLIY